MRFATYMHIACGEGIFYMHVLKRGSLKQLPDNLLFKIPSQWLILYKLLCFQTEKLKYRANDLFAVYRSAITTDFQIYLLWNLMICSGVSSEALKLVCVLRKQNSIPMLPGDCLHDSCLPYITLLKSGCIVKNLCLYMQITIILLLCLITNINGYL